MTRRPIIPTDDELAAAAEALREFDDSIASVSPVVEPLPEPGPAVIDDKWRRLAAEFEDITVSASDFEFMDRGPLALTEVDIPEALFETYWCRVLGADGQPDTENIADARRRHFRPVPRDMLPLSCFTDERTTHLINDLEGGVMRGGYCLMIRPRAVAEIENKRKHDFARSRLDACLSQFETNVTIPQLMTSRAPEMTFRAFRGRKAVADID